MVADEWQERVDVVSRTFLGLTVASARCHNHKFDPVIPEDYYALAGVFASCRLVEIARGKGVAQLVSIVSVNFGCRSGTV
jgi:hypothetical protein